MDGATMHERGLRFNYDPFFDSLVPRSWSEPRASGLAEGDRHRARPDRAAGGARCRSTRPRLRFSLNQVDGCLRLDAWSGDAGLLPRSELESARAVVAAARGDIAAGRMPEVIGLEPVAGTPDRVLADSCWVSAANCLVEEAVGPAVARVFASARGRRRSPTY